MNNFLSVKDVGDVQAAVKEALELKHAADTVRSALNGKTAVLIFLNPSLRTRLSTQKASQMLGMNCIAMNMNSDSWNLEFHDGAVMNGNKAEHVKDAARVIAGYADIIGIRTFAGLEDREKDYSEEILHQFVRYSSVPVLNLESATVHPLQSLADLMTIREVFGERRPKVVLSWAPHPRALPQAVANSFSEWILGAGYDLTIANPPGLDLNPEFTGNARILHDQREAFKDADIIYAKNWSSYEDYGYIADDEPDWIISTEKMGLTNKARFMHCLPIRRNVIAEDAVIDSPDSLILQQAENRTYSALYAMHRLLKG